MKLPERESLNIIKRNNYGNLCLSYKHQPYAKFIKYNWDIASGCVQIILSISAKSSIYKIINCNEKFAFLINECNYRTYNSVLLQGYVCIIDSDGDNKNIEIVLIPESIIGNSYNY